MRNATCSPSVVLPGTDKTVYLVMDCYGSGCVWRAADVEAADLETVIIDLLDGQYRDPRRVVAFNTDETWSQDVSGDVAVELRRRCDLQLTDVPAGLQAFVERHAGPLAALRLA